VGQTVTIEGLTGSWKVTAINDATDDPNDNSILVLQGAMLGNITATRKIIANDAPVFATTEVDISSLTGDTLTGGTLTRTSGSWADDGFIVGHQVQLNGEGVNGQWRLVGLSEDGKTATLEGLALSNANAVMLQMSLFGRHGGLTVVHGGGNSLLTTRGVMTATNASLTRTDGLGWAEDGFVIGQVVQVAGETVTRTITGFADATGAPDNSFIGWGTGSVLQLSGAAFTAGTTLRTVNVVDTSSAGVNGVRIGGDHITVTGGAGPNSPLVVFGDTSQDGVWYSGQPNNVLGYEFGEKPFNPFTHLPDGDNEDDEWVFPLANPYKFAGNDVIDARLLFASVADSALPSVGFTAYGGAGNDLIIGSQAGDFLAGGSGDDTILGQRGADQIYGDSGVNIDILTRTLTISTSNASPAPTLGGVNIRYINNGTTIQPYASPVRDLMVAGKDTLYGEGEGTVTVGTFVEAAYADIIFGDHGVVTQDVPRGRVYAGAAGALASYESDLAPSTGVLPNSPTDKLLTVGYVQDIRTVAPSNGADDLIDGGVGRDRILGGNGSDTIEGGAGSDVIFGDQGHMSYIGPDYSGNIETGLAGLGTLDLVESIDTMAVAGKGDVITDDSSDDIIFGGQGDDRIDAGAGQNIVFGDHGRILGVDTGVNRPVGDPVASKADDNYQVQVLGLVTSIDWGTVNGANNEFGNGNDTITTGIGRDMVFGGGGNDTINSYASGLASTDSVARAAAALADGNNIVFGDHGLVDYLAEEILQGQALVNPPRTNDIDRVWSLGTDMGGVDNITVGDANDIVLGGLAGDTIHAGHGKNIVFGDAGRVTAATSDDPAVQVSVHEFTIGEIVSIGFIDGGADTIDAGIGDDIVIGGAAGDKIDTGKGDNVVFGDHGRILTLTNQGFNSVVGDPARDPLDHPLTYALITSLVPAGEIGGNDTITTGIGRDIIIGGAGNDEINSFASNSLGSTAAGTAAQDGNNIVFGDYGLVDYLSEELAQGSAMNPALETYVRTNAATSVAVNPVRAADIDRIWSLDSATALGGNDTITTGDANDIILGGTGDDVIVTGDGRNIAIGDNAVLTAAPRDRRAVAIDDLPADPPFIFSVHEFLICKIDTIGFAGADSGNDIITGGQYNDVLFGGGGSDVIYAGGGDDLVFGDQGRIECKNDHPYDPDTSLRPVCWDLKLANGQPDPNRGFLLFEATNTTGAEGWGNDLIFGQDGSDLIMGQQGDDVLYGGNGDDILIGGSNVAGAHDGNDRIDGGAGADAIAGDNAAICFRPDAFDVRMRALDGTLIYGVTEGVNDGLAMIGVANTANTIDPTNPLRNAMMDPRYAARTADRNSGHAEYLIKLLDHADDTSSLLYGNDYIAGGAGEDEIFGQLGNDVIQGDGTIGVGSTLAARESYADNLAAAQLSLTRTDGSTVTITDFTYFGANRGAVATDLADFGFTMNPSRDLTVNASFEGLHDGDDYIEGNGGNDVVFGGRGQDDIIGGSSDLFGFVLATQRPDGSDLLFGGAGTDIARNDIGDAVTARSAGLPKDAASDLIVTTAGGHAHDADMIIGDNGRILRLVGVNALQVGTADALNPNGVSSTGGFLNYNYDLYGSAAEGYGTDNNTATYDRIIVRAASFLDYHEGGVDVSDAALGDRGDGDEIHGESGDDFIYGMKGNDVLFGEGQDDDLIGGYGNDWISGGTGNDGVIGDDGRILTSRNATSYGEALNGVVKLLTDNVDTRTFNGNMMDEAIATPGSIQQAVVNVGGELKKAVNLTPFTFDITFNGNTDEFTSISKKTVDDQGRPDAHNADDIIFGGLGNDWLHGGSGDDAILGGEALGEAYTQVYAANGQLTGITRSDYLRPYNPVDALRYNPVDADGWHFDRTRRAGEFALYDEYDPLRKITLNSDGTANKTNAGGKEWFLNFSTTEGTYVPAGTIPGATGQQATTYLQAWNDGNDKIFGDTGNDWLVGGTGRDNLYGGFGNDLMNADDNHGTNLLRNDQPDTQPTYEDRAFGGAGRDVLIGNTGGDRLIDWVGEFNSYLVPFAPFGMATVSRTLQPQLAEFLYTLGASDGADPTRFADTNGDPSQAFRRGEPEGELGLVRQQDFAWQSQTGAPTDPQAGNIPGGTRDVLRTANFNNGSTQGLAADSGSWEVSGGTLQVSAKSNKGDAVAIYQVGDALPNYFEVTATIKALKPTAGWNANSYIIFDYQSPTNFKYAGLDVSINKLVMGQRTDAGWQILEQAAVKGGVKVDTWYNMLLAVNGLTATLVINNQTVFSHTYAPTVDESGWSYGLNWGLVGFGSNKSRGAIDNITVQVVPPAATVTRSDDFSMGAGPLVTGVADSSLGSWAVNAGRLLAQPVAGSDTAIQLLNLNGVSQLQATSLLQLSTTLSTTGRSGIVFDRYSDTDFKFVAIDVVSKQLLIGHRNAAGWTVDAAVSNAGLLAGTDYQLGITIRGSTVSVTLNGQAALGFVFNAVGVDGRFGLFTKGAMASFDKVEVKTNDRQLADLSNTLLAASVPAEVKSLEPLSSVELAAMVDEAVRRWSLIGGAGFAEAMRSVDIRIVDLPGMELGAYVDGRVLIDINAAGHGWFIDRSLGDDSEFSLLDGSLQALDGAAVGRVDLLSVIAHELGHAVGVAHIDDGVMTDTLATGSRTIEAGTSITALTPDALQLRPENGMRPVDLMRSESEISSALPAAPKINWTSIGTDTPPQIVLPTPAKAPAWQSDFVNHLARSEAQRNPNASLRVQINLAPKVSADLSALHSSV